VQGDVIQSTIDRASHGVLVVDDQPATRYSTARTLRAAGFRTLEAGSGLEALELIAQGGVSAVVLDVHLPDIDGFEVCRRLRERPETRMLPVVHLSAEYVRNQDKVAGLNAGADAYMVHPVEAPVLVATLQALIRARTAEDELRRSEGRFRAIYEMASSGIVLVDAVGRVADANPAMLRMIGRTREEVLGQRLDAFAPEATRADIEALLRATGEASSGRGEAALLDAAGREVPLEWTISSSMEAGLRVAVANDVSERHLLDQQRRDLLEREQAARSAAERHSQTRDDFIAVLSHELRTPLSAMLGWVQILQRREVSPEVLRGVQVIERNVRTQARIISDILDVSRINAGKLRIEREWVSPADVLQASIATMADMARDKQVAIETHIDAGEGTAWLDPARFQQICWNLMSNAIKFSEAGGTVHVSLQRGADGLRLQVRDEGRGIAPEFMEHLFERFSQSDTPGRRRQGGLGLGLSIVRHLAELHGGSVSAESGGPGQGATFTVLLPVAEGSGAAGPSAAATAPAADEQALQDVPILLVEDNHDTAQMLEMVLSERGSHVQRAHDHGEALARAAGQWPRLLVCDIGLPGSDGYEVVRDLRARQPQDAPRLVALALTAFNRPEDKERALAAGFDAHVAKPVAPHVLLGHLADLLRAG
jgi:PAS domain S-box-containing protein